MTDLALFTAGHVPGITPALVSLATVDQNSTAYAAGRVVGTLVGIALIVALVIAVVRRINRRRSGGSP